MCEQHSNHEPNSEPLSHRRLGERLDLFHFPAEAPGMAFWHPRGMAIYNELSAWWREINGERGYQEVRSPQLWQAGLWQQSGHWQKFSELMFAFEAGDREMALKPMNCPGHCELYGIRPRSFRELPLRIAEQGHVHRLEASGSLNGLLRARSFCQDDAHIFCAPEQVGDEVRGCLELAGEVYARFGLDFELELALRPDERLGDDALWDQAEGELRGALDALGLAYEERPGEGAFYGPKIDLFIADSLGRRWQLGSIQLDYQLPERFDLDYVGADGSRSHPNGSPRRPVIVHRAMFGSFERFIAILLEHFDGELPLWLAPEQLRVLPIGADQAAYAAELALDLEGEGVARVGIDGDGPLGERIAKAASERVPAVAVIGRREAEADAMALRLRSSGRQLVVDRYVGAAQLGRIAALRELELEVEEG